MTHRPLSRLTLIAFALAASVASAETTYLPGAAEVTGLAGARFSSTLDLTNPGAAATTVTIGLVPLAGTATPAPVTRTLGAGESQRIGEALKTLFGLAGGAAGTITVSSADPLLASLATQNVAAAEGAYGLGLLAVAESELLGAGETGHAIWVSQSADPATGYRTNLSVTLVDAGTVVEVRVFDADGHLAGNTTLTAAKPEVWQQPASALVGAANLPVGRAEFEVTAGRATGYAVVNDNVTSDAIALQSERVVPGATDRLISGAALSPGQLGSFWSTDLRVFNPGSAAVEATVLAVGAPSAASRSVTVPAKSVVELTRVLALLGFPEGTACALRVTGPDALLVAARTNNVDPAGLRQGTFSAQQFVTRWPAGLLVPGAVGFFNGVDQTLNVPGVRTNLALVGGPQGASGELVLRDASGAERGRAAFTRGPGEWGQKGVADWFGASARQDVSVAAIPENARIDVVVGSGALDAFVSRIDNGSGDAVTRPVALPGGGDCAKVVVSSFGAAPQPIRAGTETTFSWTVVLDPPPSELTSQSIRFDGEPEVELGTSVRSYARTFGSVGPRSVTLTVRKGSCVKTRSLSFFVCGELSVEPATLPDGVAFASYPSRTLTIPGATSPTTFEVVAGSLPKGMILSAAGELSGRPEEVGAFPFTVRGTDANGCTGTRSYTLRVFCGTFRISPASLSGGTVGVPYPSTRFVVTGGSGSGSWSAVGLPPGLVLTAAGQLAGTPTLAGSFGVTVRFEDSVGCAGTATYTLLVCNSLTVGPGSLPGATATVAYGPVSFTAVGATGSTNWSVTAGSLPAGLTLNPSTGALSGVPTAVGTFPFTVTAIDGLGCSGSVAVTLVVVCPVITVNPGALATAFEDQAFVATLTQTGGGAATTFAVTAGALPAGISLSAAGAFSGAALTPGTYGFTVTATDPANGCTGSRAYSLVVTAVNDAPSFTKGPDVTVLEDSSAYSGPWATAISPGPPDEAGQVVNFVVTGNTNASLFSVAPSVSPAGVLTFTPAPNASGTATITITLRDDGGLANGGVDTSAPQSFAVTVTDVNDAPSFTKGPDVTVLEDSGARTVSPWATAISPGPAAESGQTVTFLVTANTNPALFAAGPAVSATGVLTFTPAANANGSATITLSLRDDGGTASGGVDTSATQTFVVNVTPVNDPPSFAKGADQTVFDNAGAQTVTGWATAISRGPADEAAQTVSFNVTNVTNPSFFAVLPAIDPSGTLTYTPTPSSGGSSTVTVTLQDNGTTANGGVDTSAPQTFTITFNHVNVAPSFTKGPDQTMNEDAGAQTVPGWATAILAGPPVESGQALTFNVTANSNPALFSAGPAVSAAGVLTYTPAANANGTATITLVLRDDGGTEFGGADTSASQTFVVTVNAVNDAPSFTKGPAQTVLEDAGAQTVSPWATALSAGPADEAGQALTFQVTGNTNPALFSAGPAISSAGVLTFTPAANAFGSATITVDLKDDGGTLNLGVDTSAPQTFVVTVSPVNDAPSFTKGGGQNVLDNAGPVTVNPWATAISVGPANESAQVPTFQVTGNTNPGIFSAGPAVSATGVLTFTPATVPTGTSTATISIRLTDNGGTTSGGVDASASQDFTISITHVNAAPTLTTNPVAYTTPGNTQLHVAGATLPGVASFSDAQGALAKSLPADPDGPGPLVVVPASGSSANGGSFSIAANGSFTYVPPAGFSGADTFTYQVTDQDPVAPGLVTGTVSVTVGQRVWYVRDVVDANNAAGGDGRSTNAFDSITAFNGATTNDGDVIFVFRGNTGTTALSGGFTLQSGQKLWGEGIGLTLAGFGTLVPAGLRPRISNGSGVAAYVDTASAPTGNRQNVEIRGLELSGSAAGVGLLASGASLVSVRVSENVVEATGGNGISAGLGSSLAQQVAIHDNSVTATATGILVQKTGTGAATITAFDDNVVTGNTGGIGIQVAGAVFDSTPADVAVTTVPGGATSVGVSGNGVGSSGVVLSNVTGDLVFTDLDVYADGGAGLSVSSTGALNAGAGTGFRIAVGAGVGTFDANGGPAVSVVSASANLPLLFLESTNSTSFGVLLQNAFGGAGGTTLSASSGQIVDGAASTSAAVSITGGDGNVTLGIPVTNSLGNAIIVTSRASGTVSFTGAVAETGTGIQLTSNTGATISFSGGLTANTGTNTAFLATGGGTVTVTGTANTLATSTGTALNVSGATIGAGGLTFRSISANGAPNGVVLNNTGILGGLTVTGNGNTTKGGDSSGGTIQNTTGSGILLTNTRNVSLTNVLLSATGSHGVEGTGLADATGGASASFAFLYGRLTSPGDADNENAFFFATPAATNATGRIRIDNTIVTDFEENGVHVTNVSGTLTLDVTNCDFSDNDDVHGQQGVIADAAGTATLVANVTGNAFNNVESLAVDLRASAQTATLDANVTNNASTNGGGPDDFPAGGGIVLNADEGATVTFDVNNNTLTNAIDGIVVVGEGNVQGRIQNNNVSIQALNAATGGTLGGDGLRIDDDGEVGAFSGVTTWSIHVSGNTFALNGVGEDGIQVLNRDHGGTLNLTIENNSISGTASEGIRTFDADRTAPVTAGPFAAYRIANNTFTNIAAPETIYVVSDDLASVCTNITGNSGNGTAAGKSFVLERRFTSATLQIAQASTAALQSANGGAVTVSVPIQPVTFNGGCVNPPLPTNP